MSRQIQSKRYPWNAGYAIPEYIQNEGNAVLTTKQLPRGTYSLPPSDLKMGGYALPPNVIAETPGQGTFTTGYYPRRQIESLPGSPFRESLSGVESQPASIPLKDNPLFAFGRKSANWFVAAIKNVPAGSREEAARRLLNALEPGLFAKVTKDANKFMARGDSPEEALRKALAARFSDGIVKELIATGKNGKVKPQSLFGLGCTCMQGQTPTAGLWDSIKDVGKKAGRVGAGVFTLGLSEKGVRDFIGDGLKKVGDYACVALNHPLAEVGAAAAAGAKGAPPQVGQTGVNVARNIACPSGQIPVYVPPPSQTPEWVMPAVVGGGVLLAVIALRK